jgi:hypothetical protein
MAGNRYPTLHDEESRTNCGQSQSLESSHPDTSLQPRAKPGGPRHPYTASRT